MCVFCKIINGEIPAKKLFENDEFLAILDVSPAAEGHVLVISKRHFENVLEMPPETALSLGSSVQRASKMVAAVYGPNINVLQNNGEPAGQTCFHFHVHIIPRRENDEVSISWTHNGDINLDDVLRKLKQEE